MQKIIISAYKFSELSEDAKKNAIAKHYEDEIYENLSDDMHETVRGLLEERQESTPGFSFELEKVLYSLSWSQGDGLCFEGELKLGNATLQMSHRNNHYYAKSVDFDCLDNDGEEVEEDFLPEFRVLKDIYFDVCKKAETMGYTILEYRMNNDEFSEYSDDNDYLYFESGNVCNLVSEGELTAQKTANESAS